tara:strand:- start:359 stop:706 length:348 start_codon:yes stop_codon:yes gene_type:complete
MPLYTFEHPTSGEQIDVVQKMSDKHEYVDDEGVSWNRVWAVPQASIDTHVNPESSKDFVLKTRDKKGTVGDIWERSREMSERRAQIHGGKDPVLEKYNEKQKKLRKGKKSADQRG